MITLDLPNDKQAIIQQASHTMGMDISEFIINQAYYGSLAVLNRSTHTPESEQITHPLLGMYQDNLQILGDIIESVFDPKAWENTDNENNLIKGI